MATLIPNSFTSYDLTAEETLQGSILTSLQLQVLHNHLSTYAEQKLALEYDPDKQLQFMQNEASLSSKIDLLNYLIETSEVSQDTLSATRLGDSNESI